MALEKEVLPSLKRETDLSRQSLATLVVKLRKEARLSVRALALKADVDPSAVHRIETSQQTGSPETLGRIGIALGVNPGLLLDTLMDYSTPQEEKEAGELTRKIIPASTPV